MEERYVCRYIIGFCYIITIRGGVSLGTGIFKDVIVWVSSVCIIIIYFISDYQLNFLTEMDFGIWLIFVILFDKILIYGIHKLTQRMKK